MAEDVNSNDVIVKGSSFSNETLVQFLKNIYEREGDRFSVMETLRRKFEVNVVSLREIEESIRHNLLLDLVEPREISFHGIVSFKSAQTRRYDDFETLIRASSNTEVPVSLVLSWSIFDLEANAFPLSRKVQLKFTTNLANEPRSFVFDDREDVMVVSASGSREEWVARTFDDTLPLVRTLVMPTAMAITDVRHFNKISTLSLLALIISILYLVDKKLLSLPFESLDQSSYVHQIVNERDVAKKIDILARASFPTLSFDGAGWIVLFPLVLLGALSLPKKIVDFFLPKSAIIMGASGRLVSRERSVTYTIWTAVLIPTIISLLVGSVFYWLSRLG